jgi:predicted Zn-ribbon and HTH transcriptional regulator
VDNSVDTFYRKLVSLGKEKAHERHKTMLSRNRCVRCGHFFTVFAISNFNPDKKPGKCPRCGLEDPLQDSGDPLEEMLDMGGEFCGR